MFISVCISFGKLGSELESAGPMLFIVFSGMAGLWFLIIPKGILIDEPLFWKVFIHIVGVLGLISFTASVAVIVLRCAGIM